MPKDVAEDERPRKKRRPGGAGRRPSPNRMLKPWQRVFLVVVGLIACTTLTIEKIAQIQGRSIDRSGVMSGKFFILLAACAILVLAWGIVGRTFGLAEMPEKKR